MNTAFLLTGSNMGDCEQYLATARELIAAECGEIFQASSLYETEAWGKTDQPPFLNQALEIRTPLNAKQLIHGILKIEKKMGRIRHEKYGPRLIDIDILLFSEDIVTTTLLTIPHPEMQNRRFVLEPLAEIAPNAFHPVLKKTVANLLNDCSDGLNVRKIESSKH